MKKFLVGVLLIVGLLGVNSTAEATVGDVATIPATVITNPRLAGNINCAKINLARLTWNADWSNSIAANTTTVNCTTGVAVSEYWQTLTVTGHYYNPGIQQWLAYCSKTGDAQSPVVGRSCPALFPGTYVTVSVNIVVRKDTDLPVGTYNVSAWGGQTG